MLNTDFTKDRCDRYIGIEDKFVENLRKIVDSTEDCQIVLSSTWRLGYTRYKEKLKNHMEYLNNKFAKQGLKIFDSTEDLSRHGELRGKEIHSWLEKHKDLNIDNWVVLDDEWFYDFALYDIRPHLVSTTSYSQLGGLNDEKVEEAINILNGGAG